MRSPASLNGLVLYINALNIVLYVGESDLTEIALNTDEPRLPAYESARFLTSAQHLGQCPTDQGCEIAFAGRSNAGKSSAINAITRNGQLARASKTPGRTRLINFFSLNAPECRLVDLPGYGYAKVSRELQERWQQDLQMYLERRLSLRGLVLVMDVRHPLTSLDAMMAEWCSHRGLPTLILLTKADKLSRSEGRKTQMAVEKALKPLRGTFTTTLFSAPNRSGVEQVHAFMNAHFLPCLGSSQLNPGPTDAADRHADDEPAPPDRERR